jgi:hypothetical protein
LAALVILDALQPNPEEDLLAIDLHLDTLGLFAACGALAYTAPEAALTLFERDLLSNTPLATCVVPLGGGRIGDTAVEAELKLVGGGSQRIVVRHGQIGRLAIGPGAYGSLTLTPASGVRIGRNPPGSAVESEPGKIRGSALGVLIDARPRPLRLPETPLERQQLLWEWLTALGVESGPLPYPAAEPWTETLIAPISPPTNGSITFVEPSATRHTSEPLLPSADSAAELDSLAKLRQSVEIPQKRGIFRRK